MSEPVIDLKKVEKPAAEPAQEEEKKGLSDDA